MLLLSFNAVDRTVVPNPHLGRAVIEFVRPLVSRFGYPNDEALPGHPLYAVGLETYNCYEVLDSGWKTEIDRQNLVSFPEWPGYAVRHFAFVFHDSMFECLAEDLIVSLVERT